jgi:hypothetical protein
MARARSSSVGDGGFYTLLSETIDYIIDMCYHYTRHIVKLADGIMCPNGMTCGLVCFSNVVRLGKIGYGLQSYMSSARKPSPFIYSEYENHTHSYFVQLLMNHSYNIL